MPNSGSSIVSTAAGPLSGTPQALGCRRYADAQASGGTSDDAIYRMVVRCLEEFNVSGSVLDFGAGVGRLARELVTMRRFTTVAAADILERPPHLDDRVRWFVADLNDALPLPEATFNVIIMAEVIEHLENPRAVARETFRLLAPGGIIVVTTPNNESIRSLLSLVVRGHFVAFTTSSYPAHKTALLRADLERVLCEAGFSSVHFRFSNHGGIPGRPKWRWQQVSARRLGGLRFSDNLLAIARKPMS